MTTLTTHQRELLQAVLDGKELVGVVSGTTYDPQYLLHAIALQPTNLKIKPDTVHRFVPVFKMPAGSVYMAEGKIVLERPIMTTPTPHGQVPEALRLAEQYDHGDPAAHGNAWKAAVCTELRRLAELEAQIEALSGVQALSAAPAGWKLAPVEPTRSPEALRRSTAADGKTELFNLPGYPLMVRAVDFNRIHTESEMRRAALLDEMQKAALAARQVTAAQADSVLYDPKAQAAESVPAVSDLPPLPDPDLRDVGTKPQDVKDFLNGYATEYARLALAARAQVESVTAPAGGVVAYLDIGAGGYIDLGTDLADEALSRLPKGRHALVIAGTYGIDGYTAAPTTQPSPAAQGDALSDAVRVPLDSLHADAAYPIGRLREGSMPYARVIEIIRERIDAAKAAIRARAAQEGKSHDK